MSVAAPVRTPRERLADTIERLLLGDGTYRFVLLRESPLNDGLINRGDLDLLGTPAAVDALLRRLLSLATEGNVHFRVTRSRREKVQLTIYSTDLAHSAVFDLWTALPQIDRGRHSLRFDDVAHAVTPTDGAIVRLPPCIEAAIYLHHLASKRKSFCESHTQERIRTFRHHACDDPACRVAAWMDDSLGSSQVSRATLQASRALLERRLNLRFDDGHHAGRTRRLRARSSPPTAICVQGVDGVGKTTLVQSLARDGFVHSVLTGKRLYRRSWLYQVLTRRSSEPRERFDERHCVSLFLRAAASLQTRLWARRFRDAGPLLIDRSLADFLYRGRKTDLGGLHPRARNLTNLAPHLPVIQLVAPYDVVQSRKAEITPLGQARYDIEMLLHTVHAKRCDHLVFHNGDSAEVASARLGSYLSHVLHAKSQHRVDPG